MELIILTFVLYGMVKGIKSLARMKPKASRTTSVTNTCGSQFATLQALQEQRECIKESLAWIDDLISTEEKPEKVLQWMTKRAQLKGQLATVQSKIDKLIY